MRTKREYWVFAGRYAGADCNGVEFNIVYERPAPSLGENGQVFRV